MTTMTTTTEGVALAAILRGQRLQVPDLWPAFATWPVDCSPHYEDVVPYVNTFLAKYILEPKKLQALQDADFSRFVCCWWPYGELARLQVMSAFIAWLFLWDDELDHPASTVGDDLDLGEKYIKQTELFARQCLDLSREEDIPMPESPYVSCFSVIGYALRDAYTIEQREYFMSELAFYCKMCIVERKIRKSLGSRIPTLEEFWEYRLGTAATLLTYAAADYAYNTNTVHVSTTSTGKLLLEQLNVITSITNDIFSLQKEFHHQCIESLVPLLVAAHGNPQQAMDEAVSQLFSAVDKFEFIAKQLVSTANDTKGDLDSVQKVIEAAQRQCTGHLAWGYETKRYGLQRRLDGTLLLSL